MKLVSVETPEKSVCKMTFSASPEELEAASNAVYERTRASYTIRGFKKGEADRAQIEADRGEHTFWYDAINDLMDKDVPALYDAAMAEHGFVAVDNPVYDLVSVKKDEGFVATATTALQPELNLTQTTGFKTECVTPEVTDKEIDNVLERRRAAAAELVPHKGPAVKGNIVHIDYEGLLEGKPFQGGTAKNQAVQLVGHKHGLHTVADELAGSEAVLHAHMAHGDAVAHADGRDQDGCAACHLDACLNGVGHLIQVHVAGHDLTVGAHHADEGALQLFRGVAQGVKQASVGRALRAFGHVVTSHGLFLFSL